MDGNERRMELPNRLNITSAQLETAIHIVEALANRQLIQRNLPNIGFQESTIYSLFVSDLIVKAKNTNQFYIESGEDGGFEVAAGEYFTILNQTESRVRLSFFDDNVYSRFAMTSMHLQLPNQGGVPILILEPGKEGAVTTSVISVGGLQEVWINIEKQAGTGWTAVGPGGNGANMRINDP